MDDDAMDLARRRHRRFNVALVALVVLGLPVSALLGGLLADEGDGRSHWLISILIALIPMLVVAVLFTGGYFMLARAKVWWIQPSPAWALSWRDRRRLVKDIRANRQLHGFELTAARDVARRMVLQVRFQYFLLPIWIVNLVLGVVTGSTWRSILWGAMLLLLAVAMVFLKRDARRARRFLDAQPGSSDPSGR